MTTNNEEIDDTLSSLSSTLQVFLGKRALTVPEELFHYTSTEGLLGIINSNSLRATNALYLNDATEFKHGIEQYKAFRKARIRATKSDIETEFLGSEADGIENILRNFPVYVFCLTAMANQLSQWRAYAGPKGGFAIVLRLLT